MMQGGVGVPLITSAVGYWVLTVSGKEKGTVKKIGQLLALVILAVSLVGVACKVVHFARARGLCSSGGMCPFTGKPMGSPQPTR